MYRATFRTYASSREILSHDLRVHNNSPITSDCYHVRTNNTVRDTKSYKGCNVMFYFITPHYPRLIPDQALLKHMGWSYWRLPRRPNLWTTVLLTFLMLMFRCQLGTTWQSIRGNLLANDTIKPQEDGCVGMAPTRRDWTVSWIDQTSTINRGMESVCQVDV